MFIARLFAGNVIKSLSPTDLSPILRPGLVVKGDALHGNAFCWSEVASDLAGRLPVASRIVDVEQARSVRPVLLSDVVAISNYGRDQDLGDYDSLTEYARSKCAALMAENAHLPVAERIQALLSHRHLRIAQGTDSLRFDAWTGRLAFMNSGGTQPFSAARQIAIDHGVEYALNLPLKVLKINEAAACEFIANHEVFVANLMGTGNAVHDLMGGGVKAAPVSIPMFEQVDGGTAIKNHHGNPSGYCWLVMERSRHGSLIEAMRNKGFVGLSQKMAADLVVQRSAMARFPTVPEQLVAQQGWASADRDLDDESSVAYACRG